MFAISFMFSSLLYLPSRNKQICTHKRLPKKHTHTCTNFAQTKKAMLENNPVTSVFRCVKIKIICFKFSSKLDFDYALLYITFLPQGGI